MSTFFPNDAARHADTQDQIDRLKRRPPGDAVVAQRPPFKFHFRGALVVSTSEDDLITNGGANLVVWGRLTTAGSTTTTAVVKLDGTTVVTITFASGVKNALPTAFVVTTAVGQGLAAGITGVGTGAAGLVVGVATA